MTPTATETPAKEERIALPSLTTSGVGQLLHLAPKTVVGFCNDGLLPCWVIPGTDHRRIPWRDLVAFAEQHDYPIPRTVLGINLTGLLDLEKLQHELDRRLLYLDVAADVFAAGSQCGDQHAAVLVIPRPGWERSLEALGVKFEGRVIEAKNGADVVPLADKLVEMVARRG